MPSLSLQNDFLSIHGFCSGRTTFPCSHRVQDSVPAPVCCTIDQINKSWVISIFSIAYYFNLFIYQEFLYSFPRTCFYLSILGSLCMPRIVSIKLRKIFWIFKGETILVCLPAKPLHALVLLLALTSLFVFSWTFVLTFKKGQPNPSYCKFLVLFHNCYYHYC